MPPYDLFLKFALALGLAFFFGLAFEDYYGRAKEARPGGIRTFPLLALTGGVLYLLGPESLVPLVVGLGSVATWLAIHYFRRTNEKDAQGDAAVGLMVPLCNVIAFLLGPAAIAEPLWVPAGVTASAVLFLTSRERLHRFARDVEPTELVTAGKFLVLTGLVLPLLPDYAVSSLTTITPRQAWLALIAVSSISYASYLLQRYAMPHGGGGLIAALLGGLYSSTATAVALARQMADAVARPRELQAGVILSTAVMYARVLVVVSIFNLALAAQLLAPMLLLSTIAIAIGSVSYRMHGKGVAHIVPPTPGNPLAVSTGAVFAVLFILISIATSWVRSHFGIGGLYALAGLVGFADVDPFVLNLAEGSGDEIASSTAAAAIVLATSSNNLLKAAYVVLIAGKKGGLFPACVLVSLAVIGAFVALGQVAGN